MKEKLDKLKQYFVMSRKINRFLMILFVIALICGSFYLLFLSDADKTLMKDYMAQYFQNLNKVNSVETFFTMAISNIVSLTTIWLLGISVIGVPILLFFFFSKSFILGLTISSFLLSKGFQGIFYAFVYLFPYQIVHILIYLFLLNYALSLSLKFIESFCKKKEINFKVIMKKYCIVLFFSLFLMVLINVFEAFLMPKLLLWVLSL